VLGTQAQTDGELSNLLFTVQRTFWTQVQMPPQSAPPAFGSQVSLGSSVQRPKPGQGFPVIPPHETFVLMHFPVAGSQSVPAGHSTAAQPVVGGGLHLQVGQPLASRTLPYSQKMSQTGGQVAGPHLPVAGSQVEPAGHSTAAQRSPVLGTQAQ